MQTVTLNLKEQKRLLVLNRISQGELNGPEPADLPGLSGRHVRRMLAAYRKQGAERSQRQRYARPFSIPLQ